MKHITLMIWATSALVGLPAYVSYAGCEPTSDQFTQLKQGITQASDAANRVPGFDDRIKPFLGNYTIDSTQSDPLCSTAEKGTYQIAPYAKGTDSGINITGPHGEYSFSTIASQKSSKGDDAGPYWDNEGGNFDGKTFETYWKRKELMVATIIPIPIFQSTIRKVTLNDDGSVSLDGNFAFDLEKKIKCHITRSN